MIEVQYNVHSLVGLRVTGSRDVIEQVDLHLADFRGDADGAEHQVVVEPYSAAPPADRDVVIDDIECGEWTLHRAATHTWMAPMRRPSRYAVDRLTWPINLIVQLALMRTGRTFTHASAVDFHGAGLLFPAYPGTGKTTTSATLVEAGGKFLGDDLCILGDGRLRAYPQALSVYPHHLEILGYEDPRLTRAFARGAMADRAREAIEGRRSVPMKAASKALGYVGTRCVNVMPDEVFGPAGLGREVALNAVVMLQRSGSTESLRPVEMAPESAARQSSVVLWHEWHASVHELLLLDAVNAGGNWFKSLIEDVAMTTADQFAGVACYRVDIPASWPNARLRDEFPDFIQKLVDG